MRVLYALGNYPQLSETYVDTEIEYAQKRGAEIEVWATGCTDTSVPAIVPVHRGRLIDTITRFRPHVIHLHHLNGLRFLDEMPPEAAVTVRSHSFDFSVPELERACRIDKIRRVYAFPHFARQCKSHPKLQAMTVAYSSTHFQRAALKDRKMVLRLAAGRHNKGLEDFFQVAAYCPHYRFVLGVAEAGAGPDGSHYVQQLQKLRSSYGGNVDLRLNVPRAQAIALTHQAGIYLDTNDPAGHEFGMPISIAESMATGSYVLSRFGPTIWDYVGTGGDYYLDLVDAADKIKRAVAYGDGNWSSLSEMAFRQAERFQDVNVLPQLVADWEKISKGETL